MTVECLRVEFKAFLVEVENWMRASSLRLNLTKTQVMWFGAKHQIQLVDIEEIDILSARIKVSFTARDLGLIIDSQLSLSDHITASAGPAISNFDSCARSFARCRPKPQRH
jgi:hypothetical protein